jgi:HK97 family phage major capsid protein
MEKEVLEQIKAALGPTIAEVLQKDAARIVGEEASLQVRKIVDELARERALFGGKDKTGLTSEQKENFVTIAKAAGGFKDAKTKANEAIISETDDRGGYLIPTEVEGAIMRIAATVGFAASQVQEWPLGSDERDVPNYTGSFLEGEFLGVDAAGSVTPVTFGQAKLTLKKWQIAFVVGEDVLKDATVALADWLIALAAEAYANMLDKQVVAGNGTPFTGVLNHTGVQVFTLSTGKDTFAEFNVVEDAAEAVSLLEESLLDGACFVMHRTVWAKIRVQKDGANHYILADAGAASAGLLAYTAKNGGPRPAGEMGGYPVYTVRHMPPNSASAASTKFMIFGNFRAALVGVRSGEGMTISQYTSGTFGGKEIALADQRGLVIKKRVAVTVGLPQAFVVVKTAAS